MNNEIKAYYDFINSTAEQAEYIDPIIMDGYVDHRERNHNISKAETFARNVWGVTFKHVKGTVLFGMGVLAGIGAGGIVLRFLHMSW